jgi:hypothetical protein
MNKSGLTCFQAVTHLGKRRMTAQITIGQIATAQIGIDQYVQ